MNKAEIDRLLPDAYKLIKSNGIASEDGKVQKTWRGQIASFGAAISMGSLLSAVAFFSAQGRASVEREKLLKVIYDLIQPQESSLFEYVTARRESPEVKEKVINAATAVKLALNLYVLE